jgi:hypothetical protein
VFLFHPSEYQSKGARLGCNPEEKALKVYRAKETLQLFDILRVGEQATSWLVTSP